MAKRGKAEDMSGAATGGYWSGLTQSRLSRRRLLRAGTVAGAGALALSLVGCAGGDEARGGDASGLLHQPVDTSNKAVKGGIYTIDTRDVASFDTQSGTDATHAMHAYSRLVR